MPLVILIKMMILYQIPSKIVPYIEGQKVFAAIKSPKELIAVKGAGHVKFDH
jgi:hypothetical protein